MAVSHLLFRPRQEWRNTVMCLSVCPSVRGHISGTTSIFTKFVCMFPIAVAWRLGPDGVAVCYALPVFWMTSHWLGRVL